MKAIWNVLCVIAIANLLALGAFVGWLLVNDRLNGERVEMVRVMLTETIAEEEARIAEAEAQASAERDEKKRAEAAASTVAASSDALESARQGEEIGRQVLERLRRELDDLRRTLEWDRQQLDSEWEKLYAQRAEFARARELVAQSEGSEQFDKALRLYESLKAETAMEIFQQLIADGQVDQVVSYLNAMQARQATKIIEAIPDPVVAADLLERLRTRGLQAQVPQE